MTASDEFTTTLRESLDRLGIVAEPDRLATLAAHFQMMLEANRRFNLTRITVPSEAAALLYADSAAALGWAICAEAGITTVLDVGTGAGFPAVPLAVLAPAWRVTALEATGKKARFVQQTARRLGINNLQALHAHSDHWTSGRTFDLVTFKAIGRLDACVTAGRRYLASGGCIIVYKTASISPDELRLGRQAAERLRLEVPPPFEYELAAPSGTARLALHLFARRK